MLQVLNVSVELVIVSRFTLCCEQKENEISGKALVYVLIIIPQDKASTPISEGVPWSPALITAGMETHRHKGYLCRGPG